jgi:DNA-directed RNA polymerase specialized sigma24 family protein
LHVPALSTIEEHVVLLVADGRNHREVADELGLSLKTVEWHAARARRKLEHVVTLRDRIRGAADDAPSPPQSQIQEDER